MDEKQVMKFAWPKIGYNLLDCWTGIFDFTHAVAGLLDSCWFKALRKHAIHH